MTKKVILFDIDYTLFNTDKFRNITYPKLMDILEQEDTITYHNKVHAIEMQLIAKGGYEPVAFAKTLSEALEITPQQNDIEEIFYNPELYKSCLYPEVGKILTLLSNEFVLGIISKGEKSFQKRKIAAIKHFFSEADTYISLNKFDDIDLLMDTYKNKRLFVIDDSAPFLHAVKQANASYFTCFIERESRYEVRETPPDFSPDATINTLNELLSIVDKVLENKYS